MGLSTGGVCVRVEGGHVEGGGGGGGGGVAEDSSGANDQSVSAERDQLVKKLNKMKKKYNNKISSLKEEMEEMRDDFYFQRQQLMDAMTEQEKDAKLYELICQSVLSEKDLRRVSAVTDCMLLSC